MYISKTMRPVMLASALSMGAGAVMATPALAQKTISGGFDVGPGGLPGNFNPLAATAGFTWLSTYYEPLVIYSSDLARLEGDLAKDYSVSDGQLVYTFDLADAKWHDGKPFISAEVKFTLGLAMNAASGSVFAARLKDLNSVETPDSNTVVASLKAPNAASRSRGWGAAHCTCF